MDSNQNNIHETSKPSSSTSTVPKLSLKERQALLSRLANPDAPRNIQKRQREKTLAAICSEGHKPITKVKLLVFENFVFFEGKQIDNYFRVYEEVDPIGRKITEYIRKKTLVTIKLRNRNHFEMPNRTIMVTET